MKNNICYNFKNRFYDHLILFLILSFVIALFAQSLLAQSAKYGILLIAVLFLLLVTKHPLAGLIVSIPLVLYFSYVDVLWISPWNYLSAVLGCLAIVIYYRRKSRSLLCCHENETDRYTKKLYWISVIFLILMTIVNYIQEGSLILSVKFIPALLLAFCTMVFIRNENHMKLFVYCLAGCMSISAFVGIMQFLGIDFFWQLREQFETNDPVIALQLQQRHRIAGLAFYNVQLCYHLASVTPMILVFCISSTRKSRYEKMFLAVTFFMCLTASVMSFSKSLVIGIFISLVWVVMASGLSKKSKNAFLFLFFALLSLMVIYCMWFEVYSEAEISLFKMNSGNLARIPLFRVGLMVLLANPWGIGAGNFNGYAGQHYYTLRNMPGAEHLLDTSTHNQFLNTFISYGVLGGLLLILFYYYLFKGLIKLYRRLNESILKDLVAAVIASLIAYLVHSMFHNAGIFSVDPFGWYFVGMSFFLFNYSHYSKAYRPDSQLRQDIQPDAFT